MFKMLSSNHFSNILKTRIPEMLRQYQRILFACGHRSLSVEVKGSKDHLCADLVRL